MRHRVLWLAGLALPLAVGSCQPRPPALSEADRTAIRGIFDASVARIRAGDFTAWAAEYTEDGVLMPPNHPAVHGRAALKAWADSLPPITAFSFSDVAIDGAGDIAVGSSAYAITFAPPGLPAAPDSGKQLVVFRRQQDGSWLVTVVSFNSDLPLVR